MSKNMINATGKKIIALFIHLLEHSCRYFPLRTLIPSQILMSITNQRHESATLRTIAKPTFSRLPIQESINSKKKNTKPNYSAASQALAGFLAGATSTMILHPLDLIKTQFQVNEQVHARLSLRKQIRHWVSIHGAKSLYRGLSPNLAGATASWGLFFWWYALIKERMLVSKQEKDGSISNQISQHRLHPTDHLLASAQAGLLTTLFTNPLWLIKTRMCTQPPNDPNAYKGLFDGLRRVWQEEGFKGLYRGIIPAWFGVTHGAIQFMVYEEMKHLRAEWTYGSDQDKLGTAEYIIMAASSKIVATASTYPYQVVKSRLQVQQAYVTRAYSGVLSSIGSIYRAEGIGGFYKGLGVNIIRVLPGTCITFVVFEGLNKVFKQSLE